VTNSAFSAHNPKLQIGVDATSLKSYQFCPRRYQYEHIENWRRQSVDLDFGLFIADSLEIYQKGRLAGLSKTDALLPALRYAFTATWNADGTQWGGEYVTQWHCLGETKYNNEKGNLAMCPFALVGGWLLGLGP
jgi:hypothetical protein